MRTDAGAAPAFERSQQARQGNAMTGIENMKFQPNPRMSWSDQLPELVIYDQDSGNYHALNASASAIWRALQYSASTKQIIEVVAREMAVAEQVIEPDVTDFLRAACTAGLIVELADRH